MSDSENLVVVNHSHPKFSNQTQYDYLDLEGENHQADYVQLAEKLPEDFDLVFAVTNHYETEGIEFWEELQNQIQYKGGEAHLGDIVFEGELDGKNIYGLQGVEAAFEDNYSHEYIMHGLELGENSSHIYDGCHEMLEATEDAALGTLPHVFLSEFDWGSERRENFFETAQEYDVDLSIEYSHGYGILNLIANGRISESNIANLCDQHQIPAIPGADWHSMLPKQVAIMQHSAVDTLEEDRFPLKEFKDMKIARKLGKMPKTWNRIRDTFGAGATYGDMIPIIGKKAVNEDFQDKIKELSLKYLEELNSEQIQNNAVRINGRNGILSQEF